MLPRLRWRELTAPTTKSSPSTDDQLVPAVNHPYCGPIASKQSAASPVGGTAGLSSSVHQIWKMSIRSVDNCRISNVCIMPQRALLDKPAVAHGNTGWQYNCHPNLSLTKRSIYNTPEKTNDLAGLQRAEWLGWGALLSVVSFLRVALCSFFGAFFEVEER